MTLMRTMGMLRTTLALLLATTTFTQAWTTPSRRDVLNTMATGLVLGPTAAARAIEACPSGSNNCVRTSWAAPSGTSKKDAVSTFRAVLDTYPQEGQEGNVDGGGWAIAEDALDSADGTARVEFKSSGKGNFAKFFNRGKPFTDDLSVQVQDNGTIEIRSASRVGDSDFGVNQKRVDFLAKAIKTKGWSV